jgi:excisionase family DNA binding protein
MGFDGEDRLWTPEEAASFLGVPKATLAWWRSSGRGPRYVKCGRAVRYRWRDVEDWITECTERNT